MTYTGTGPQHLLGETIKMSAISGFAPLWSPGSAWSHIRLDALEVQWCCRFPINGPEESPNPAGASHSLNKKKLTGMVVPQIKVLENSTKMCRCKRGGSACTDCSRVHVQVAAHSQVCSQVTQASKSSGISCKELYVSKAARARSRKDAASEAAPGHGSLHHRHGLVCLHPHVRAPPFGGSGAAGAAKGTSCAAANKVRST